MSPHTYRRARPRRRFRHRLRVGGRALQYRRAEPIEPAVARFEVPE